MSIKPWIQATRPKTLPAAISPVLIATSIAWRSGCFQLLPALAVMLCAVLIQIATNFANDVVDHQKGSDDDKRVGPQRVVQAGLISSKSMWRACILTLLLSLLLGVYLVYLGGVIILLIGLSALFLAVLYSATKWALSYRGTAEPFVLLYFGPVATSGTEIILCNSVSGVGFLAGCCCGAISTAILSVNNLRDLDNDKRHNKKTLAVRLGAGFAKAQYSLLMIFPALIVCLISYLFPEFRAIMFSLFYLAPASAQIRRLYSGAKDEQLNSVLSATGKTLMVFSILFSIGILS